MALQKCSFAAKREVVLPFACCRVTILDVVLGFSIRTTLLSERFHPKICHGKFHCKLRQPHKIHQTFLDGCQAVLFFKVESDPSLKSFESEILSISKKSVITLTIPEESPA